ncbi:hypothetical protein MGG_16001 [Pyricularia oryzae 70-15]|uniref:Uncharacterized protein n=2 Tax=Pyricularia oryzae TaxID=318829 RepID=G4MMS6_PYRO7|nr:uncharacterized protein MGG_16001 [Pyricularia oryzae 70-15]EHA56156.1 hypothetical protein MGG_16001 [Pyricularia oryzae 70-15]ELQ35301.1 hypothetical protein OOU_Y34scaffold00716g2 [Pyricularia oryzae Y34]
MDGNKDNENKYPRSLAQRTAESRSRYFRAIVFFVDLLLTQRRGPGVNGGGEDSNAHCYENAILVIVLRIQAVEHQGKPPWLPNGMSAKGCNTSETVASTCILQHWLANAIGTRVNYYATMPQRQHGTTPCATTRHYAPLRHTLSHVFEQSIAPSGTSQLHPPRRLPLVQVAIFESEAQQQILQDSCSDAWAVDGDMNFGFVVFANIVDLLGFRKLGTFSIQRSRWDISD